jgi:hypothetical protein
MVHKRIYKLGICKPSCMCHRTRRQQHVVIVAAKCIYVPLESCAHTHTHASMLCSICKCFCVCMRVYLCLLLLLLFPSHSTPCHAMPTFCHGAPLSTQSDKAEAATSHLPMKRAITTQIIKCKSMARHTQMSPRTMQPCGWIGPQPRCQMQCCETQIKSCPCLPGFLPAASDCRHRQIAIPIASSPRNTKES